MFSMLVITSISYLSFWSDTFGLNSQVVEFIAVLLEVGGEAAEKELIKSSAIQIILDLFFK